MHTKVSNTSLDSAVLQTESFSVLGQPIEKPADTKGAIYYDPDSADDLDDDDPDEDLDI